MSEWGLPSIQTIDCVRVVVLGVGLSRGGASVAGRVTSAWAEPQDVLLDWAGLGQKQSGITWLNGLGMA